MKKVFLFGLVFFVFFVFFASPAYCGMGGISKEEMVLIENQYVIIRFLKIKPYNWATDGYVGWERALGFSLPKIMAREKRLTFATEKNLPWVQAVFFMVVITVLVWPSKKKASL